MIQMIRTLTANINVLKWIEDVVQLTNPDNVIWIDGSEEQLNQLRKEACDTGEIRPLNSKKYPGC